MKNIPEDWRDLCEIASKEQDSEKLLDLITKINQALEECNRQSRIDRTPIKINHVLLPASMARSGMVRPSIEFEQVPGLEYDC